MKPLTWLLARADDPARASNADEIRAELEHHLACARAELERAGLTPAAAAAEAERRFGARARVEAECLAVHGGIMGTRLHAVVTALLLVTVLVLSFVVHSSQAAAVAARDVAMREQEAALHARAEAEERARSLDALLAEYRARGEPQEAVEERVIRVGDELELFDLQGQWRAPVRVAQDGEALIPEVGWVSVEGLTREALERHLTEVLKPYFVEVDIKVLVNPTPFEKTLQPNNTQYPR